MKDDLNIPLRFADSVMESIKRDDEKNLKWKALRESSEALQRFGMGVSEASDALIRFGKAVNAQEFKHVWKEQHLMSPISSKPLRANASAQREQMRESLFVSIGYAIDEALGRHDQYYAEDARIACSTRNDKAALYDRIHKNAERLRVNSETYVRHAVSSMRGYRYTDTNILKAISSQKTLERVTRELGTDIGANRARSRQLTIDDTHDDVIDSVFNMQGVALQIVARVEPKMRARTFVAVLIAKRHSFHPAALALHPRVVVRWNKIDDMPITVSEAMVNAARLRNGTSKFLKDFDNASLQRFNDVLAEFDDAVKQFEQMEKEEA